MLGPAVVDVAGLALSDAEAERLRHPLVGMVILFARNFENVAQLQSLCAAIHAVRTPPLLIAVDHEGGRVQRFREGFTQLPAPRRLGELWDRDVLDACRAATAFGFVLASELRSCGVDLSFAPVLDLDWQRSGIIGARALHGDPRVVALLAAQLTHGMRIAGMANCGKHFPGHGWAEADSHHAVPYDKRARGEIIGQDAAPYGWLGTALAGVMPAHVIYPKVDAQPAGFSRRWIGDVLRGELRFSGAVFSDDLSMAGARVAGDVVAGARAALAAGCDFILVCNDPASADRVLADLRWTRTAAFDERLARLRPQGDAMAPEALRTSALYRAAQRDLAPLLDQSSS
jgi:beta-N-acetylhexosaminidase